MIPASGVQFELRGGGYVAEVAGVGASLRTLRYEGGGGHEGSEDREGSEGIEGIEDRARGAGRDLVAGFAADELRPGMRGALLAPWPNRVADGRYRVSGVERQLDLSEPERGNAAHGLVAWQEFAPVGRASDRLVLGATIQPSPGYPWRIELRVTFEVGAGGLRQEVVARNLTTSSAPAPFGVGGHPYLLAGPESRGAIDAWTLHLEAEEALLVSPDRLLPTRLVPVSDIGWRDALGPAVPGEAAGLGTARPDAARPDAARPDAERPEAVGPDVPGPEAVGPDVADPGAAVGLGAAAVSGGAEGAGRSTVAGPAGRVPGPLAGRVLNNAFTGLRRGPDGLARVSVTDASGVGVEVAFDARCRWVQIYTADDPSSSTHRGAVAVEPMTCPPDAFNSGSDLLWIAPGASVSAGWTIRALG